MTRTQRAVRAAMSERELAIEAAVFEVDLRVTDALTCGGDEVAAGMRNRARARWAALSTRELAYLAERIADAAARDTSIALELGHSTLDEMACEVRRLLESRAAGLR